MNRPSLHTLLVTLATLPIAGLLLVATGHAGQSTNQNSEKSREIERYLYEPLELIDLKVGEHVIKEKPITKFWRNDVGLDNLIFRERNGWFKHVLIRFRNVSGRPIYGVRAFLYFQSQDTSTLYSLPVQASTLLKQGVLDPGAEVSLSVSDQSWALTADTLRQSGVDPDLAPVKFSIDMVRFSDALHWSKGHLLSCDPDNPDRWNVIDTNPRP